MTPPNPPVPDSYRQLSPASRGVDLTGRRGRSSPSKSRRVYRRRRTVVALFLTISVFFLWSVFGAMATPGNQGFSAKWADWGRSHHVGFVINRLEAFYYTHHAPAKGGRPRTLNALPGADRVAARAPAPTITHLASPTAIALTVIPALPGEGQWQPVGPLVSGIPGVYEAQFRADNIYTSEITSAVWIDPLLMRVSLTAGLTEPGGTWDHPPYITPAELPAIVAAFNGGFRFQDAQGGFYLDGRVAVPLRDGAASVVIYRGGRVNVGAWGSEVTMTSDVVAVLQNLVPMVDGGQVSSAATYNDAKVWGTTLGAAVVVARSGIGVTADGGVVYVAGPALTARTLAESLQRAGAVRAMTLDINPEWVSFNFYDHPNAADPNQINASKLYPQMKRPATRYLGPTLESRDFFSVSLAPPGA